MTAMTGCNLRASEGYWELSGPSPINRNGASCRACRKSIFKDSLVYVRDGRKLRFFYHIECFRGTEDPRTQEGSSYSEREEYHRKLAPNISSLEGPRACKDADGRELGREVFKPEAPSTLGRGKWSVAHRGYQPNTSSSISNLVSSKGAMPSAQGSTYR